MLQLIDTVVSRASRGEIVSVISVWRGRRRFRKTLLESLNKDLNTLKLTKNFLLYGCELKIYACSYCFVSIVFSLFM